MDKALNQLSVPLGQLREEVMVCTPWINALWVFVKSCLRIVYAHFYLFQSLRSCVSEVIQAIDNQLFKQEVLQNKKVWVLFNTLHSVVIISYLYSALFLHSVICHVNAKLCNLITTSYIWSKTDYEPVFKWLCYLSILECRQYPAAALVW